MIPLNKSYKFSPLLLAFLISLGNVGCKKLVEVKPPKTSINGANVYSNDATASAALTGIYTNMASGNILAGGITSLSLFPALSADELTLYTGTFNTQLLAYYTNTLTNTNGEFWNTIYPTIFLANSAIEGLNQSQSLTPAVKQQLLGEAKFIRAFCYFYLVNLYGDVPLALSSDYRVNMSLPRSPKNLVYQQIITDFLDAQGLLNSSYLNADVLSRTMDRVRPTKWAATALLARAYLYIGDWGNADAQATAIINNNSMFNLVSLNDVFLKNSLEAIWQLQPVLNTPSNTWDGWLFVLPPSGPNATNYSVYLNTSLVNSFDATDKRKSNWIDSIIVGADTFYYPFKYKIGAISSVVSEYPTVLRLAEQYLIRAEARAQLNNLAGAQTDLNAIRARAELTNTSANDQTALLEAVRQERKLELFTEWGHRWLDLKRTNKIDGVMSIAAPKKGGTWNTNWQWYPIPQFELEKDPKLVQNAGY